MPTSRSSPSCTTPTAPFLYGDHFVFLKDGVVERLSAAERPWDRDFLERIYDTEMDSIPYGDRAFVVPKG